MFSRDIDSHVIMSIDACFCMLHSIGPINVGINFEINQYTTDEFRKHGKNVCYVLRQVTIGRRDTSDRYFNQEHVATKRKSVRLPVKTLLPNIWNYFTL